MKIIYAVEIHWLLSLFGLSICSIKIVCSFIVLTLRAAVDRGFEEQDRSSTK